MARLPTIDELLADVDRLVQQPTSEVKVAADDTLGTEIGNELLKLANNLRNHTNKVTYEDVSSLVNKDA